MTALNENRVINLYGHYYKNRKGYRVVDRITVIGFEGENVICVKGHITDNGEKPMSPFKMPKRKIRFEITSKEMNDLLKYENYKREEKRRKKEAKKKKELAFAKYLKQCEVAKENLSEMGILVPVMADIDLEDMERLLDAPDYYIPELKEIGMVKLIGYDSNKDDYYYYAC